MQTGAQGYGGSSFLGVAGMPGLPKTLKNPKLFVRIDQGNFTSRLSDVIWRATFRLQTISRCHCGYGAQGGSSMKICKASLFLALLVAICLPAVTQTKMRLVGPFNFLRAIV